MGLLHQFSKILCVLCVSATLSLSACTAATKPIVQTQIAQVEIPAKNRTCPGVPPLPDPDQPETSQRDVSVWTVDAVKVIEKCRSNLNTVVNIVDDFNQTAAAFQSVEE